VVQFNWLLTAFLFIYLLQLAFSLWMERLNRDHLRAKGSQVPPVFEGFIDQGKLARSTSYTLEKSRFASIHGAFSALVMLAILLSGFLPWIERLSSSWQFPFLLAGLFFFIAPGLIDFFFDLPFDYYQTFVIEEKYGFNRATRKVWIMDQVKAGLLSLILFGLVFSLILWMIRLSPLRWWLWGFLILSAIQILLTVLYPVLIAPIFNKFVLLQDQELALKITSLVKMAGFRIKGIFQMDAGKRSRHTNAYFTGLGRTKRIVLYDTLIQSHPQEEILAVLAHEIGHYKGRHIVKQLLLFEFFLVIGLLLTYRWLDWPLLYRTFGFDKPQPYVGLFILGLFWQKAGFFLAPFYMALSRRFERQADRFALVLLKSPKGMVEGLKRLAADNLSNLFPHPFYVWFHYSHPPLLSRIALLEKNDPGTEGRSK
jgi:STE24 endopeptidase